MRLSRTTTTALYAVLMVLLAASPSAGQAVANVAVTDQQQRPYHLPTVTNDPMTPGRVAISYHDDYAGDCYLARSSDGGGTWTNLDLVGPGGTAVVPAFPLAAPYARCLRPSTVFAPDGTLYYVYSAFQRVPGRPFGGYSTLFFTASRDGGITFTTPVRVDPGQPPPSVFASGVGDLNARIAVDESTGRVYVGWHRSSTDFYSNADGFIASSTDGGRSFSPPVRVNIDPQKANLVIPTVGPDGRLSVAYQDFQPFAAANGAGPINLFVVSSSDGGAHFGAPVRVAAAEFGGCAAFGCQQDGAGNYTRGPMHDINAGRSPGQLFYTASWYRPDVGVNRSQLWVSNDAGRNWSEPQTFGIPEGAPSDGQLLPSLSVASNSRVDIGYYDLMPDLRENTYLTSTRDGGQTFSAPRKISDIPSDTRNGPPQDFGNDSYTEGELVSSTATTAYIAWEDSRRGALGTNKLDIFATSVAFAPDATPSGQPPAVTPPPPSAVPGPPPAACGKSTSKLALARATFDRATRSISILAPITRLASGSAKITLLAARKTLTFNAPIDSRNGRIRVTRTLTAAQTRLGTGIVTIRYDGDADTRPQNVRLRAADNPAGMRMTRPTITANGFLRATGSVTERARGVVRVQLEYTNRADGQTVTIERAATIRTGRWSVNSPLSSSLRTQIAQRCGTLHSYTLFTGSQPQRIRGEQRSFQVLPPQQ